MRHNAPIQLFDAQYFFSFECRDDGFKWIDAGSMSFDDGLVQRFLRLLHYFVVDNGCCQVCQAVQNKSKKKQFNLKLFKVYNV